MAAGNGARIYSDTRTLCINDTYVSLEEDVLIAIIARMSFVTILNPPMATVWLVRIRNKLTKGQLHYIEQIDLGYLNNFPCISVTNALVKTIKYRRIPIGFFNNTNQTVKLR